MKLRKSIPNLTAILLVTGFVSRSHGAVRFYGDMDVLNTNSSYTGNDGTTGATLEGLLANQVTFANQTVDNHDFPFSPEVGDYPGTDQIYVGSTQTGQSDGYSQAADRINGPQVISMDYSSLIPTGQAVQTVTLGIGADDFQFLPLGNPFAADVNNQFHQVLTDTLNGFDQTGPDTRFFSIGIDSALLEPSHVLELRIDQGGDGSDGWAIDYLTVGVTTIPEPATMTFLAPVALLVFRRRRKSRA